MGADFTASIRYNPEAKSPKPAYTIACRQLGISESGSGDLEEMVQTITDKIREKISEEFRTMPRSVSLIGYGMTLRFEVIGPINRSLQEFGAGSTTTIRMSDGTEISIDQIDKLTKTSQKVLDIAKRTGKTPEQVLEEAKTRLDREKKAAKAAKGAKA